jgi:hypothetical protein
VGYFLKPSGLTQQIPKRLRQLRVLELESGRFGGDWRDALASQ